MVFTQAKAEEGNYGKKNNTQVNYNNDQRTEYDTTDDLDDTPNIAQNQAWQKSERGHTTIMGVTV